MAARLYKWQFHSSSMGFLNKLLSLAVTTEIYTNANTNVSDCSNRVGFFLHTVLFCKEFQRKEPHEVLTSSFQ